MSTEIQNMTDEEIAKWQNELYELECDCSTSPLMTEEEKMQRIREFLSDGYREKLLAKAFAKKKEYEQELANTSDPKQKARLQRNIDLISTYKKVDTDFL